MAISSPNMDDCSPKCKCRVGLNAGQAYDCSNPCGSSPTLKFDPALCDCAEVLPCGGFSIGLSGGAGTTVNTYNTPGRTGDTCIFSYQAYTVPDQFIVSGAASFSFGPSGGSGTVYLPMNDAGYITVTVSGPSGTGWNYSIGVSCAGD